MDGGAAGRGVPSGRLLPVTVSIPPTTTVIPLDPPAKPPKAVLGWLEGNSQECTEKCSTSTNDSDLSFDRV